MKTKGLAMATMLLISGAYAALSATVILGFIGTAKPMATTMINGMGTVIECLAEVQADPSEENIAAQQEKVNKLTEAFAVPAWVNEIQVATNTPDMTEDDTFLGFLLNAMPEAVQSLYTEGKIVDVANGDLDELDFVLEFANTDEISEEDFDAAIAELEELKAEFKASMEQN